MEQHASVKIHNPSPSPGQQLPPQDWETIMDDFQTGDQSRLARWLPYPLLDLALHSFLRRDFPFTLKHHLLLFLEDSSDLLFRPCPFSSLPPLIDALRSMLHSSADSSLREQAMVSTSSIIIAALDSHTPQLVDPLVELLLSVVNRPNHSPDRQTRSVACECLRELELAFPLLLSDAVGHLWSLAQAERTHAAQSYLLLLATAVASIVRHGLLSSPSSILSTAVPIVPFNSHSNFPFSIFFPQPSDLNLREVRRVIAFLLERPLALTPCATMELVSVLSGIVGALERYVPAVATLLKVQCSALLYCYDPILCHVVLMLYWRFSNVFAVDDELDIARRLALIPKEAHQPLVFRLLAIHWLLGSPQLAGRKGFLPSLAHFFYPSVLDPLSLKAAKLDALACVTAQNDLIRCQKDPKNQEGKRDGGTTVVKLFEDALLSVSEFKWLPPWSMETSVAFRALHKFLIGVSLHRDIGSFDDELHSVFNSSIFQTLQNMLVELPLAHRGLIPVIATFVDRLIGCKAHRPVGEHLLQTLDEQLLPKLDIGYLLASYFPIFERIAGNDTIPPLGLLGLLTKHMLYLAHKHGPDSGLRSWSQGSKVLGICRTMLMHHRSSRVFLGLSYLLSFTCKSFPDLEVRDSARIYMRMLLCVPGKKLKKIMDLGGQLPGMSPSPHQASLFQVPSPRHPIDPKKHSGLSSYIHLERAIQPLVKQSWALVLPNSETEKREASYFVGVRDIGMSSTAQDREAEVTVDSKVEVIIPRITLQEEPLRVMDSKVSETVSILRRHFACVPDYRHMPGTKIRIPCILRFEAEPFYEIWGSDSSKLNLDVVDSLPALYATTVTFKSTAKYGSIPACHVSFLLGGPSISGLDIIPSGLDIREYSSFQAPITIELEPREPMPGLIDTELTANIENGHIISGMLQNITVGFGDMFLKVTLPSDVADDGAPQYYLDLFHALWEACGSSSNTGREAFPLYGGKGAAAIYGTRSVKLLDITPISLLCSIERYLAPFVVSVNGQPLVDIIRSNGVIRDVIWEDDSGNFSEKESNALIPYSENTSLQLEYTLDKSAELNPHESTKRSIGTLLILVFLPPRFHLLLQIEIGHVSTLVRIRTDHWPCLAYVDEYLESLINIDEL